MQKFILLICLIANISFADIFATSHKYELTASPLFLEFLKATSYDPILPIRTGNEAQVALLSSADDAFAARVQSILSARKSIHIQALLFQGDEAGYLIAYLLKEKKKRGLEVKVIVDAASNLFDFGAQSIYADLEQAGIQVLGYGPLFSNLKSEISLDDPADTNKRFHDKMWIIDDKFAIVGGRNIGNNYFEADSSDVKGMWRDQDIAVTGEIVKDIKRVFDRNYKYFYNKAKGKDDTVIEKVMNYWNKYSHSSGTKFSYPLDVDPDLFASLLKKGNRKLKLNYTKVQSARFVQSRPRLFETFISQTYIDLINRAKEEIIICNAYFVPIPSVVSALENAVKRGVKIVIMTNSVKTTDLAMITELSQTYYYGIARHEYYGGGMVDIYEWNGGEYNTSTNHSKFAIFDQKEVIIGSYNLDPRSENLNSETVLAVRSPEIASNLREYFYANDIKKADFIPLTLSLLYWNLGKDTVAMKIKQMLKPHL